jgi:hypothetical protein
MRLPLHCLHRMQVCHSRLLSAHRCLPWCCQGGSQLALSRMTEVGHRTSALVCLVQAVSAKADKMCMSVAACSTVAVVQHQRLGNIDVRMALALVAGSAVGSAIGAHTALQTPPLVLELAFSGGIMWLAHKTLKAARAVAK